MYNPELKEQFVETRDGLSAKKAIQFFNRYERWEEKLGKDISQMTKEEIIQGFEYIGGTYSSLSGEAVQARRYLTWCSENDKADVSARTIQFSWTDVDLTAFYKRFYYKELEQIFRDWWWCQPSEGDYIQPYYLFIWYGMSTKEFFKIKRSDVVIEEDSATIKWNGEDIVITNPAAVSVLSQYNQFTATVTEGNGQVWYRPNVDTFFYNKVSNGSAKRKEHVTGIDAATRVLFYKNSSLWGGNVQDYDNSYVKLSGLYSQIIKLEQDGASQEEIERLKNRYGVTSTNRTMVAIYKKSLETYRNAFYSNE